MRFTTLFFLASAVVSGLSQGISLPILQDSLAELRNLAKSFNDIIPPYGITVPENLENTVEFFNLLVVHAATVDRAARQVRDITTPKPLSAADSVAFIASAANFEPIIMTIFELIKSKKDILRGLVSNPSFVDPIKIAIIDLTAMRDASTAFASAVNDALASPSKAQWTVITGRIIAGATELVEFYQLES